MPSPLNLPKKFATEPTALARELERQSQELDRYLREQSNATVYVPQLSLLNPGFLAFGQMARVDVPDGMTLVMQLPPPNPAMLGKKCGVRRSSMTGEVLIYAVGCLVAGQERYRLANDIHFVEFLFDGNYYPSRAGGGF